MNTNLVAIFLLTVISSCVSGPQSPLESLNIDEANVINVKVDENDGYTFWVTVRHNDTGWDHYVDWWRIKTLRGDEIARRILLHPHVDEQPFTRSLERVTVPEGMDEVIIEAHDLVHGYGGQQMVVTLKTGATRRLD